MHVSFIVHCPLLIVFVVVVVFATTVIRLRCTARCIGTVRAIEKTTTQRAESGKPRNHPSRIQTCGQTSRDRHQPSLPATNTAGAIPTLDFGFICLFVHPSASDGGFRGSEPASS